MRGVWLIYKKEMLELSKDRKTLFFLFILPVLLYPMLMFMIGSLTKRDAHQRQGKPSRVVLVDPAEVLGKAMRLQSKEFEIIPMPSPNIRQDLRDQKYELHVVVDSQAQDKLHRLEPFQVKATHDETERASSLALKRLKELLKRMDHDWVQARLETFKAPESLVTPSQLEVVNAGDLGLMVGKLLGGFIPYIVMIMMFAGAMQPGIYATAGEKERGTLLSLLSTRLPRVQIIWGKLLFIFSMGLISALVNTLVMGFSMGRMVVGLEKPSAQMLAQMGPQASETAHQLSALADPMNLFLSFLILIPLGLFFANFILLMGIQAKNTIEAGSAITPGIIVVVVMGVFSLAPGLERMPVLPYVPILNVSLTLRKMFSQQFVPMEYGIALGMTLLLAIGMTTLATYLLKRESVMFTV